MLLGTWANMMLYMLEITQVCLGRRSGKRTRLTYFQQIVNCFKHYPNDPTILKCTIWLLLAVDTASSIASCSTVYMVSRYCRMRMISNTSVVHDNVLG